MAPEHRTEVLTSHSTWKPSDSAQAFCTCGWHGYTYDGFDGAANVERSVAEALAHFAMPVVANGRIYRPEPVCTVCGEPITDRQNVVAVGPALAPQHTDAFHAELAAWAEDETWAMAQRTPEGFGGESEDES
jgi:hypothetical protein